jgi:hypothetical protein
MPASTAAIGSVCGRPANSSSRRSLARCRAKDPSRQLRSNKVGCALIGNPDGARITLARIRGNRSPV